MLFKKFKMLNRSAIFAYYKYQFDGTTFKWSYSKQLFLFSYLLFCEKNDFVETKKKRFLKSKQGSFFVRCCFCINLFSLPWKKSEKKTGYSIFRIKYKKKALLCHAHANRIIIFRCVSNSRIYIIIIFQ